MKEKSFLGGQIGNFVTYPFRMNDHHCPDFSKLHSHACGQDPDTMSPGSYPGVSANEILQLRMFFSSFLFFSRALPHIKMAHVNDLVGANTGYRSMHLLALFGLICLIANRASSADLHWFLTDKSNVESSLETSEPDFMEASLSPKPFLSSGIFLNVFDGDTDNNDDDDASSLFLAEITTSNNACENNVSLQPLSRKLRARNSCPINQVPRVDQHHPNSQIGNDANMEDGLSNNDDKTPLFQLNGIPLVDFRSIDRKIGYCPGDFYHVLIIPVCASENPADIRKSFGLYYNLDHAMRGMVVFSQFHFLSTESKNPEDLDRLFRDLVPH